MCEPGRHKHKRACACASVTPVHTYFSCACFCACPYAYAYACVVRVNQPLWNTILATRVYQPVDTKNLPKVPKESVPWQNMADVVQLLPFSVIADWGAKWVKGLLKCYSAALGNLLHCETQKPFWLPDSLIHAGRVLQENWRQPVIILYTACILTTTSKKQNKKHYLQI